MPDRWMDERTVFQLFGIPPESSTINDVAITGKLTRSMKAAMYLQCASHQTII